MASDWTFVSVDVELTNHCMSDCIMCPREAISRPTGFMTEVVFNKLSEKLIDEGSLITFSGMGDPLLHPKVFEWICSVRLRGGIIGVVVNPDALHSRNSRKLVKAGPNSITLSFPSLREKVFERLCPSISFSDALNRAKELIGLARGNVGLRVMGIQTDINRNESVEYASFWRNLGVPSSVTACHGRGGNVRVAGIYSPESFEIEYGRCGLFSFHTFVTWEGEVLACCHDLTGSTGIGSLVKLDISLIVERKQRIIMKGGMPFSVCRQCDEPLRRCVIPQGLPPASRKERNRFFREVSRNTEYSL
ncbi:MAG: radical SAM protein [Candidatus Scalindua sp.]|nr:radical SAM protein [Candidatus Scalindua sp.]